MTETQIIVKSFRRFEALERFVRSVRDVYPEVEILVADDSFEVRPLALPAVVKRIQQTPHLSWIQLPFDSGLAAGRNRLVRESSAPILILCDDDFAFTAQTRLDQLLILTEQVDVAAGAVESDGRAVGSLGRFRFTGEVRRTLELVAMKPEWLKVEGVRYQITDMPLNFFAARREILERFPWDERFKITGEHLDFFLSLYSGGVRVAYTPDVVVDHVRATSPDYPRFRRRQAQFRPLLARKWGLVALPDLKPVVEEAT